MPECRFQLEISQFKTERKRYFTDTYVENTQPMVKPLASSPKSSHIAKFFADVRGPTRSKKCMGHCGQVGISHGTFSPVRACSAHWVSCYM